MPTESPVETYLEQNFSRLVDELQDFLKIPSISALPEHASDVKRAAEWLRTKLDNIGFSAAELIETERHPLVYAERKIQGDAPTLLLYGHYDVQPTDPLDEWQTETEPFSPTIRGNDLFARGACDDKGQTLLAVAALEAWLAAEGELPVNVKILIEGEEESGGESIASYVTENPEKLACDLVLVCDTHMVSQEQPSLISSLRGVLYTEIEVQGAKSDLHSGNYGGVAPNPIHALCLLLARLKGEDGTINIPELNAVIPQPAAAELKFWQEDPLHIAESLKKEMGVEELVGENNLPALQRLGLRPTLEVHGIRGGFTGAGAKTVIPAKAVAKVSLRLPPGIDPDQVFSWLEKAATANLPAGHAMTVTNLHAGAGVSVDTTTPYFQAAAAALAAIYGVQPVFMREGGSIPIAALFDAVLKAPVILMGFGLPDDNLHAPNEKFSLDQFRKGMLTVAAFLGKLPK